MWRRHRIKARSRTSPCMSNSERPPPLSMPLMSPFMRTRSTEPSRLNARYITMAAAAVGAIVALVVAAVVFRSRQDPEIIVQLNWTIEESCPDAVLIGAAGSGQRDDVLGVGPQVESALSGFSSRLREQSSVSVFAGFMALDYPAPGLLEGSLQGLTGNSMFESISQGRETMTSLVGTISARCQDSVIYLIGFSQGASVVHTAVVEMPRKYQNSMGGAVVLADPHRDADDPSAQHFTTEPDPDLVGSPTPHTRDGSLNGLPLPSWVEGSFYSACARRDTVCNFSLRDLLATSEVHSDETYNGLGPQMGRLLADDLLNRK
jgi:cutinase